MRLNSKINVTQCIHYSSNRWYEKIFKVILFFWKILKVVSREQKYDKKKQQNVLESYI